MSFDLPLAALDADELGELRDTVRSAATQAGYPGGVRQLEGKDGLDSDLWTLLAQDIGLAALGLPESAGGLGGLAEIIAVAEELGGSLAPVPFVTSTVLCGQILASTGDHGGPYLDRIAAGGIAAAAITNDRGAWSGDDVTCSAEGDHVSGTVRFVAFGAAAEFFLVAARTGSDIALFAVEAADARIAALPVLDFSMPFASVIFENAPAVPLANGREAIDSGVDVALIAIGADQLGGSQHCFDMTLEYIKLRRQFNREIGSFQAVKHRMADALVQVELLRSGLDKVSSAKSASLASDAAVIKAWGSDAYRALTAEAVQLHGGVGFTWEHDAHLYFRRARADAALLGDSSFQRERIATLLDW